MRRIDIIRVRCDAHFIVNKLIDLQITIYPDAGVGFFTSRRIVRKLFLSPEQKLFIGISKLDCFRARCTGCSCAS